MKKKNMKRLTDLEDRLDKLETNVSQLEDLLLRSGLIEPLKLHVYPYNRTVFVVGEGTKELREDLERVKTCLGIEAVEIPAVDKQICYIRRVGG